MDIVSRDTKPLLLGVNRLKEHNFDDYFEMFDENMKNENSFGSFF